MPGLKSERCQHLGLQRSSGTQCHFLSRMHMPSTRPYKPEAALQRHLNQVQRVAAALQDGLADVHHLFHSCRGSRHGRRCSLLLLLLLRRRRSSWGRALQLLPQLVHGHARLQLLLQSLTCLVGKIGTCAGAERFVSSSRSCPPTPQLSTNMLDCRGFCSWPVQRR